MTVKFFLEITCSRCPNQIQYEFDTRRDTMYAVADARERNNWQRINMQDVCEECYTESRRTTVYKHDCDDCMMLGKCVYEGQRFDLYHCTTRSISDEGTVIARFGNEPDQYHSYPVARARTKDWLGDFEKGHPLRAALQLIEAIAEEGMVTPQGTVPDANHSRTDHGG